MTLETDHEKTFIEQMKQCREARNMSQADLAQALNKRGLACFQQTIGKIERGARQVQLGEACLIADALGVGLASMTGLSRWPSSEHIARIAELEQAVANAQSALAAVGGAR